MQQRDVTEMQCAEHNRRLPLDALEPAPDEPGENPWHDLWFYSNPIFIEVE